MTGAAETPSSTVRYVCPLEWCGWTYEAPTRAEGVLPSQFADAYRRQAARTEIAIAAHLGTHPRVDFVAEIHRLRNAAPDIPGSVCGHGVAGGMAPGLVVAWPPDGVRPETG